MNISTYRSRRARTLCVSCGKVKCDSARCPVCVAKLSAARAAHNAANRHPRSEWGSPPATLEDIGDALGLTKECIRQLQDRALLKMVKRSGLTRDEVLQGLAILGCQAGEIGASA